LTEGRTLNYTWYTGIVVKRLSVVFYKQAARSESNVIRDRTGCIHLGQATSIKKLFARKAQGARKVAKSR